MSDGEQGQAVPDSGAATPRLADVLNAHTPSGYEGAEDGVTCFGCDQRFGSFAQHAQHQAAMWREACMIRTWEQLDALPNDAVIRSRDGIVSQRYETSWVEVGNDCPDTAGDHMLPALLLWHPGWSAS